VRIVRPITEGKILGAPAPAKDLLFPITRPHFLNVASVHDLGRLFLDVQVHLGAGVVLLLFVLAEAVGPDEVVRGQGDERDEGGELQPFPRRESEHSRERVGHGEGPQVVWNRFLDKVRENLHFYCLPSTALKKEANK